MKDLSKDIGVYFVGGEPTAEYINLKQEFGLENVNFVGFKNKEELKKYYMAADVFVLPTREDIWGLVINEAMANGLPIISTDRCVAATELVENGVNGYIVQVDNVEELSCAIEKTINDNLRIMGQESLDKIKKYTFESMAKQHVEIFNIVMKKYKN
jgi:glycosyltransferase involved in cell wall biosynthesis